MTVTEDKLCEKDNKSVYPWHLFIRTCFLLGNNLFYLWIMDLQHNIFIIYTSQCFKTIEHNRSCFYLRLNFFSYFIVNLVGFLFLGITDAIKGPTLLDLKVDY